MEVVNQYISVGTANRKIATKEVKRRYLAYQIAGSLAPEEHWARRLGLMVCREAVADASSLRYPGRAGRYASYTLREASSTPPKRGRSTSRQVAIKALALI